MKKVILLTGILALAMGAMAQKSSGADTSISQDVNDDTKTMNVKLTYKIDGELKAHYKGTFNVAGMNKAQKEAIVNHIMDSLGIPKPVAPTPPTPPAAPKAPKQKRFASTTDKNTPLYTRRYA